MTDIAVLAALLRSADRISQRQTLMTEAELGDAARSELALARSAGEIGRGIDHLLEWKYLHEYAGAPGHFVTDRQLRGIEHTDLILTDPRHTNPRVSWDQCRDPDFDRSHPLNQPQRFSIVSASQGEGIGDVLNRLELAGHPDIAHNVYGNESADIGRFALGTPQLISATNFVALATSPRKPSMSAGVDYDENSIVVISDTAFAAARLGHVVAATAAGLGPGKVIIVMEPGKSSPDDLISLYDAIRSGAVSDTPAPTRFVALDRPEDLEPDIAGITDRIHLARHRSVAQAAAELSISRPDAALVTHDEYRLRDLNLAAWSLSADSLAHRSRADVRALDPVRPDLYSMLTGAGIRDGDVIRVSEPGSADLVTRSLYTVMNVRPLEAMVIAKSPANRYVRLHLPKLANAGAVLSLYRPSSIQIRQGDRLSIYLPGRGRCSGRASLVAADEFAFGPDEGGHVQISTKDLTPADVRLDYARARIPVGTRELIAASGIHDISAHGTFNPGAAYTAAALDRSAPLEDLVLVTEDSRALLRHSRCVHPEDAARLKARARGLGEAVDHVE